MIRTSSMGSHYGRLADHEAAPGQAQPAAKPASVAAGVAALHD